jgi:hypothetical protein
MPPLRNGYVSRMWESEVFMNDPGLRWIIHGPRSLAKARQWPLKMV